MTTALQLFGTARLSRLVRSVQDPRLLPADLTFSGRVPEVLSFDGEITARDTSRVLIADILADDSEAGTYSFGRFTTESVTIPNLKIGVQFTQAQLAQLQNIGLMGGVLANGGNVDAGSLYPGNGQGFVLSIMRDRARRLALGIAQRKEALITAMMLDTLTYDRFGVKITAGWGMPTELKTTLTGTRTWDNAATAKPVEDILYKKLYAKRRFGEMYNRITMSTTDLMYATATTDFINRAQAYVQRYGSTSAPLPQYDLQQMTTLFSQMTGMQIELKDSTYWQQNADGSITNYPFWPVGTVLFSNTADDGNSATWDVADTIVTESIVGQLIGNAGGLLGNIGAPARGPLTYATGSLNPPNVTLYTVKRCMPRKHRLTATATMVVGTYEDLIPATEVPIS